jgi:hypothetical protein
MRLSVAAEQLLRTLGGGGTLKVHRTVDGAKLFRLYPLGNAAPEEVQPALVESLQRQGLIQSNLKFPAAVYLLTDQGIALAARLIGAPALSVGPRRYTE